MATLSSIGSRLEGEADVCYGFALQRCDRHEWFQELVQQLPVRDRAMFLLIGSTGLRRSEMIVLTWSDRNLRTMEVNVLRSCVGTGSVRRRRMRLAAPFPRTPSSSMLCWNGAATVLCR